ncbi:MAG: methionine synthase [Campylobacteraceae bacterium]|nr:methionine synthase [Campylobacteraceae bacterium]
MKKIEELLKERIVVIDGAMGTEIQKKSISKEAWGEYEGCNELLNIKAADEIRSIHRAYYKAGADISKANTFGCLPWVLDEYGLGDMCYELTVEGIKRVKEAAAELGLEDSVYVACSLGPGTKLPSLGHIEFDEMKAGYELSVGAAIDAGADIILFETCQDPLQIKAALIGAEDAFAAKGVRFPIMVSATIEMNGTMLIGTDAKTLATILAPFEILSLGFNCGTGPEEVAKHVKALSEVWDGHISVHANAGLPQNRGGYTFYPMGPSEFASLQKAFCDIDGVAILGGCCGTTPQHILELAKEVKGFKPKAATGSHPNSLASLFESVTLVQEPSPLYIGERSNATGSKAFRELLLAEDYDGAMSVAYEQVRSGAHVLDVSVAFAGRDERKDMKEIVSRYASKLTLPLMPDSTQIGALEVALKLIGGRAIVNSVNLEDGIEKFDAVCALAKRFGAALVCLTIDEKGMAKTKERKLEIAERIYERAVNHFGFKPSDLVFDMLTFTVGSGDSEYFTAAIETIEAIREFHAAHPEAGFTLGVSNISFGLSKHSREVLNSVFLHHAVKAGLSTAIVNVKNTLAYHSISDEEIKLCEDLLFNKRDGGYDPLGAFINYFAAQSGEGARVKDDLEGLDTATKIKKLLIAGDKERLLGLLPSAKEEIAAENIVNELLIGAMKEVGELFGDGRMQLPFVLQAAETMKAAVDFLAPYLPKTEKSSQTTLILGTVKGDVHDVGKNLVDIILTNNGFKVINIGIKADIELFIEKLREFEATNGSLDGVALGMSGLLVKSTQVMKENLEELKRRGITVPVILGGAALNLEFVSEYCRPVYDGPVIYSRDAFDAITTLTQIERGEEITLEEPSAARAEAKAAAKEAQIGEIIKPQDEAVPTPPFWGRHVWEFTEADKLLAFEWINHRMLFKERWGYKSKGMEKNEYEKQLEEVVKPAYERLKKEFLDSLFAPVAIYGYYPVRAEGEELLIFGENEGWVKDEDANCEDLHAVRCRANKVLSFPRAHKTPRRSIPDYFRSDRHDVLAMSIVSVGDKLAKYEKELFDAGKYHEYYLVHGLAVELAEAMAEMVHKRVRIELGILRNESADINEVKMTGYHGCRYSFGYPSCPDLEMNRALFELLRPEEYGVTLSETCQIVPEASTSAIIVHHSDAQYFNI